MIRRKDIMHSRYASISQRNALRHVDRGSAVTINNFSYISFLKHITNLSRTRKTRDNTSKHNLCYIYVIFFFSFLDIFFTLHSMLSEFFVAKREREIEIEREL